MQGVSKLLEIAQKIKSRLNPKLTIGGIFITQYDRRKVLARNVIESLQKNFKGKIFDTKIRTNIALAEAPTRAVDIFRYAPKSYGAMDYFSLCKELAGG